MRLSRSHTSQAGVCRRRFYRSAGHRWIWKLAWFASNLVPPRIARGGSFLSAPYPISLCCSNSSAGIIRVLERELGAVVPHVFHHGVQPIKSFRRAWRSACKRAGLVGMIPHDFRRTAVRNLERAGVSRSVAMKLVGHKTESVYRRYAIVSSRDLNEGVAKLAALRQSASEIRKVIAFPAESGTVRAQFAARDA